MFIFINMNEKVKQLYIQKILQEYNLINVDYELKNTLVDENRAEFLKIVNKDKPVENDENSSNNNQKKKEEQKIKDSELNENTKSKIKKIYREIVKLTHPDKVDSELLKSYYVDATKAYDNNDLLELFVICGKLQINVDLSNDDIELLNNLINIKKGEIKKIEDSYIWLWINAKTDEQKQLIINSFIEHCKKTL